jgi:hypothetical protein
MFREGEEVHVTTEEARAGSTNMGMRYVLAISLALVIVALSAIWMTGAIGGSQHPSDNAATDERAKSIAN